MSDHPRGRLAGWILLALAGLAIAVALSVTASNLSTQPIGLSGVSLRAGDKLAPARVSQRGTAPATVPSTTSGDSDRDQGHELKHDSDDD